MSRETIKRVAVPLMLLCAMVAFLATSYRYDASARTLPVLVATATIVLLVLEILVQSRARIGRAIEALLRTRELFPVPRAATLGKTLEHALAWPTLLAVLTIFCGLLPAVTLYIAVSLRFVGGRSWLRAVTVALLVAAFSWGLFEWAMAYELYRGLLWEWFAA